MLNVLRRRFLELLVPCVFFSFSATALNIAGIINTESSMNTFLFVGDFAFIVVNTIWLRHCYFDLRGKKIYFISNISAYLLFLIANILAITIAPDWLGTWLFLLTKFMKFTHFGVSSFFSLIIFHVIGLLMVFFAPLGMRYIIEEQEQTMGNPSEFMLDWGSGF